MEPGNGEASPAQMDAHDPGQHHADQGGEQRQRVILLANDFVVKAENMLPNEAGRSSVLHRMCGHIVHCAHLTSKEMFGLSRSCIHLWQLLQRRLLLDPAIVVFLGLNLATCRHAAMPMAT